jgi:hypothetical protein
MSKGVEPILVIKQKIIGLSKAEPTIAKGVIVAIKIRYSEPKFNQHNGSIVKGVPKTRVKEFIV